MKYRKDINNRSVFFKVYSYAIKKKNILEDDIIELWYRELPLGFKNITIYVETYSKEGKYDFHSI